MVLKLLISLIISYIIGSFPTAYFFGRLFKGIDIRQHGSGNVGATNAFRVLGKKVGISVLIIDILKGTLAVAVISSLFGLSYDFHRILLGVTAVAGHNWSIFLKFKGGKGVATSAGVLLGLAVVIPGLRLVFSLTVVAWLLILLISGFVSISSISASVVLPLFMLIFNQSLNLVILGVIFCLFIIWRHRSNIKKLFSGNESQLNFCLLKRKRFPK